MAKAKSRRKMPVQLRSKATVDALLEAAAQVFSRAGFVGASTNSIAERAGVSIGSLYQYFPDKKTLLEAVNERYIIGLWRAAGIACQKACSLPWPEALRHIVSAKVDYHRKAGPLFLILQNELPTGITSGLEIDTAKTILERELLNFLVAHKTTIQVDTDRALYMLPIIAKGVIATSFLANPEDLKSDRIVEEVTKVLNHYLTTPDENRHFGS